MCCSDGQLSGDPSLRVIQQAPPTKPAAQYYATPSHYQYQQPTHQYINYDTTRATDQSYYSNQDHRELHCFHSNRTVACTNYCNVFGKSNIFWLNCVDSDEMSVCMSGRVSVQILCV